MERVYIGKRPAKQILRPKNIPGNTSLKEKNFQAKTNV